MHRNAPEGRARDRGGYQSCQIPIGIESSTGRMTRRRAIAATGASAAAAAFLAACGGGDDDSGGGGGGSGFYWVREQHYYQDYRLKARPSAAASSRTAPTPTPAHRRPAADCAAEQPGQARLQHAGPPQGAAYLQATADARAEPGLRRVLGSLAGRPDDHVEDCAATPSGTTRRRSTAAPSTLRRRL